MATKKIAIDEVEVLAPEKKVRTRTKKPSPVFGYGVLHTVVIALVFLLPLFVLPTSVVIPLTAKTALVYLGALVLVLALLVRVVRQKDIAVPFNAVTITGVLLVVAYVVAGAFSYNPSISFFGRDFALDSVMSMLVFFGLFTAVATLFKDKIAALYVYSALVVSGTVVLLVQLLHLFIPAFPTLGVFTASIANLVGKWNDLGLFAILLFIIAMLAITYMPLTKVVKVFLYVVAVLTGLIAIIVNISLGWWLLGVASLIVGTQAVVRWVRLEKKQIPVLAIVGFVVSALFLAFGQPIGSWISDSLAIQHVEVRPSMETTLTIAQRALTDTRTTVGVGPALFENQWPFYRPVSVLETNFWNIDFRYGFGLLPTFIVTTGLLGAITWVAFLGALLWVTFRAYRVSLQHDQDRFLRSASAFTMWFLWIVWIVYLPTIVLAALTFVVTGLFVAMAHGLGALPTKHVVLRGRVSRGMLRAFVVVLLCVAVLVGLKAVAKVIAHGYYQKSITLFAQTGDAATVEPLVATAARIDPIDTYFKSLAEIEALRLQRMVNAATAEQQLNPDEFKTVANRVIEHYNKALAYDLQNHNNYMMFADFYTSLAALGTDGVYEPAKQLYGKALELKPNNPAVYLAVAELEFVSENIPAARAAVDKALELKPNFSDAYLFLTQIELAQGSTGRALETLKRAAVANPNDAFIYFQLGLLEYDAENFTDAVRAFERAVGLNPQLQNAKYFLGLSYYEVGENTSALRQFEELLLINKDNAELKAIIENVRAGRAPIEKTQPLETLEALPLTDSDGASTETEDAELAPVE